MTESAHALGGLSYFVRGESRPFEKLYACVKTKQLKQNPLLEAWKRAGVKQQSDITPLFYNMDDLGELGRAYGRAIPSYRAIQCIHAQNTPVLNVLCAEDRGYWAAQLIAASIKTTVIGSGRSLVQATSSTAEALASAHYTKYTLLLVAPTRTELEHALSLFRGTHVFIVSHDGDMLATVLSEGWAREDTVGLPNFPPMRYQLHYWKRGRKSNTHIMKARCVLSLND